MVSGYLETWFSRLISSGSETAIQCITKVGLIFENRKFKLNGGVLGNYCMYVISILNVSTKYIASYLSYIESDYC